MTRVASAVAPRRVRTVTPGAAGWLPPLLFPVLLGIVVVYLTAIMGLAIGFTYWNFITDPVWAGWANFEFMLGDRRFWTALGNTGTIVLVTVPAKVVFGLIIAVLLSRIVRFSTFFRLAIFFPTTCSVVAIAFVWMHVFDTRGLLNNVMSVLGLDTIAWFSPAYALTAVNILIICSGVGYVALLFLAGLHSIPPEYYEAARIDGASGWTQFVKITLPLLTPTTFFVVLTGVIGSMQTFGEVYIIDGPRDSTLSIASYIYEQAFTSFDMGYASAMSGVLIVMLLAATGAQLWLQQRWVTYDR